MWRLTQLYQHPDHAILLLKPDGVIAPRGGGWTVLQPEVTPRRMVVEAQELFPWVSEKLRCHEIVVLDSLDDLPPDAERDRENFTQIQSRLAARTPGRQQAAGFAT